MGKKKNKKTPYSGKGKEFKFQKGIDKEIVSGESVIGTDIKSFFVGYDNMIIIELPFKYGKIPLEPKDLPNQKGSCQNLDEGSN